MPKLKIAMTGATGFSGGFIVPQLLADGHKVTVLARDPAKVTHPVKIVQGDLANLAAMADLVKGADVVLHVAAAVSAPNREAFFEANLEGTKRMFAAAVNAKVERFIYVSSLAAREPGLGDYGASKAVSEEFLLSQVCKMEILILRPPALYGPGDPSTLPLFDLLHRDVGFIAGKKQNRFSVLHVADFARSVVDAVLSKTTRLHELDDLKRGYSWAEFAAAHAEVTGLPKRLFSIPYSLAMTLAWLSEFSTKPKAKCQDVKKLYHADWVAHGKIWPLENTIPLRDGIRGTLQSYYEKGWLKQPSEKAKTRL